MFFGCTNCCLVPIVTSRCHCYRYCDGTANGQQRFNNGTNAEILAAYNALRIQTIGISEAAIGDCSACDGVFGIPPQPLGPAGSPSGWLCGGISEPQGSFNFLNGHTGECPRPNEQFPPNRTQAVKGDAGRGAMLFGLWGLATPFVVFTANEVMTARVCFIISELPVGRSMRTQFGVSGIRVRYRATYDGQPLAGKFLSHFCPDSPFDNLFGPAGCEFEDYGINPCAIGYGLADSRPCEGQMEIRGRGPMKELLEGRVSKEGDLNPTLNNSTRIFNFDSASDAWNIEATEEKKIWFLACYPDPVWWPGNPIPAPANPISWSFGASKADPFCVTLSGVDFLDDNGAVLRTG